MGWHEPDPENHNSNPNGWYNKLVHMW